LDIDEYVFYILRLGYIDDLRTELIKYFTRIILFMLAGHYSEYHDLPEELD